MSKTTTCPPHWLSGILMNNSKLYDSRLCGTLGEKGGYLGSARIDPTLKDLTKLLLCTKTLSLAVLAQEFELFSYGVLLTRGRLTIDPVVEFANRRNTPTGVVGFVITPTPVFTGISSTGEKFYDHILSIAKKEAWPDLAQWLDFIGGVDRTNKLYWQVIRQFVPIPDVFALERMAVLSAKCPVVPIHFYGIASNQNTIHLVPAQNPPIDLPYVRTDQAEAEIVTLANRILGESDSPLCEK